MFPPKIKPLRYFIEYQPIRAEITKAILSENWVRRYSIALSKFQWGNIVGKYSQNLVGDSSINFDRIISEALDEIAQLDEELLQRWRRPAPVIVS